MSGGALDGLRVVDLSRVLGGPFCTQILGDHGADVIKVEPPRGDETRAWGPPFEDGASSYFVGVNRNKRGIVLDLGSGQGRAALHALLSGADVLVENFKPGTMERWGIGFPSLEKLYPRLVHCRISGFGAEGPLGGLPGYDAVVQAMVGLMSVNGAPEGPPTRMGVPVVDLATGLNAALGILMALHERGRSGRGQFIDVALYDCGFSMLHPHLANMLMSGQAPRRSGNAHPNIAPYDSFPTALGDIFLAVGNDEQFRTLCDHLGEPGLAGDPRFVSNADRAASREALRAALEPLLARWSADALAIALMGKGVPAGAVQTVRASAEHAHARHRGLFVEQDGYRGTASPIRLNRTPASYRHRPPKLGEHDDEVLGSRPTPWS